MRLSDENRKATDKPTEMVTLSTITLQKIKEGYIENFNVKEGVMVSGSDKTYLPSQVNVVNFYRFEGDSDPADNSILYVIETDDGHKGIMINAMGAYADEGISRFMMDVDEMKKKIG